MTVEYIKEKFRYFNRLIFGGRLPEPIISLCEVTSFVAQYKSKWRTLADGMREPFDHQLRFSTAFRLSERELEDTVIHEMIHYFIAYNGLQDRTAHGPLFKALMNSINENYGRQISISHRINGDAMGRARSKMSKWHVVAILYFSSGEKGVKVLPRVIPKVLEYYKTMMRFPNITRLDLYLHNDGFFNRYPTSTGRRCHAITDKEISEHLQGAHVLKVEGDKLVQK